MLMVTLDPKVCGGPIWDVPPTAAASMGRHMRQPRDGRSELSRRRLLGEQETAHLMWLGV